MVHCGTRNPGKVNTVINVKLTGRLSKKRTSLLMTPICPWTWKSHTFMVIGSNLRSKSADSCWMTGEWNTRKSLPQSTNCLWPSGCDEQVPPPSPSTGTSEYRNQSDETDADIGWRFHLQLVSPELPLPAGALRNAALPKQDSSISPASWRCSPVIKCSQMTLSIVLLFQTRGQWW